MPILPRGPKKKGEFKIEVKETPEGGATTSYLYQDYEMEILLKDIKAWLTRKQEEKIIIEKTRNI